MRGAIAQAQTSSRAALPTRTALAAPRDGTRPGADDDWQTF